MDNVGLNYPLRKYVEGVPISDFIHLTLFPLLCVRSISWSGCLGPNEGELWKRSNWQIRI